MNFGVLTRPDLTRPDLIPPVSHGRRIEWLMPCVTTDRAQVEAKSLRSTHDSASQARPSTAGARRPDTFATETTRTKEEHA